MTARSKKILFYVIRNLLLFLFFVGWDYFDYLLMAKKDPNERFSPSAIYITAIFLIWAMIHNSLLFEKLLLKAKYFLYTILFVPGFSLLVLTERSVITIYHKKQPPVLGTVIACFVTTCAQ
jgi:hypothetical protein